MLTDGSIMGLAVDWVTGNLYGGGKNGIIFVCSLTTTAADLLNCVTLLSGREYLGYLWALAVEPIRGLESHKI